MNRELRVTIPWSDWRAIMGLLPVVEGELQVLERLLQVLAELLSRQTGEPGDRGAGESGA